VPNSPFITGVGLATPLGNTTDATWRALGDGGFVSDPARVPGLNGAHEPRVNMLACRVAREAIASAGWNVRDVKSAALIVGTSKGAADAWIDQSGESHALMLQTAGDLNEAAAPSVSSAAHCSFGLAETASAVAAAISCEGPRLTLSAACASGLHALIRAALMIRAGEVTRALVVASESSLHPLFVGSFRRLGVLAPAGHGCRPFDKTRAGFVIGEAAAAICLEAPEARRITDASSISVEHFALGADATHLTHGDPSGATLRSLLARVIDRRPIDLLHAHGTGTLANDPMELQAIENALAPSAGPLPSLYSHKGALGHSLGAAGLVSIAINCLAHRHGMVPPNVQTHDPLPAARVRISCQALRRPIRRSLALAAGFGGAIAVVSLASSECH